MPSRNVEILDTTLRDGAQAEGISFSVNDKFQVVETLVELGIRYIEAGNPGSNPKDREFYERFKAAPPALGGSMLAAFSPTRRKNTVVEDDEGLRDLLAAGTPVIVIFGKVWDLEVRDILRCTQKENIAMIRDSVAWCRASGREVIFDAEHYFEACAANHDYALSCLQAACDGGASVVCLCDTNGASMPEAILKATSDVVSNLPSDVRVGIHCHNDAGLAVANTLAAVSAGATHVQGTLNGVGERCGNANLSTIIANLHLKYEKICVPEEKLASLAPLARRMADIANLTLPNGEPYVGLSAFSHKGGMHVDGVKKNPVTFEHIDPGVVGNSRRFLLSEVSGRSAVLDIIRRVNPDIARDAPEVGNVLQKLKEMEHQGFHYEGAEASLELLVCKELGLYTPFFSLEKLRIASEQPRSGTFSAYTYIKIMVDSVGEATAAEGEGPVNAMDRALKKAMNVFYPELTHVRLTDFKVRVINSEATASKVRTLIESTDGRQIWNTVGVSNDILEASWQALVDSLEYKLMRRQLGWEE
ncbi:MAG: citramalate synthase [Ruminococcaceae bacterium]|nr:citramalate synthase [Oscillospiraceae bacterium]